jgi:hypothetical protein
MRFKAILFLVLGVGFIQLGNAQPATTASTPVWNFLCERYAYSSYLEVQISKTTTGGLLTLALESTANTTNISGTTYLFLHNNTVITCTDKNKRSNEGSKIISHYTLNAAEMKLVQQHRIDYIHFNIKGNSKSFSGQLGNFTALNKRSYFGKDTPENPNYFDTAADCKALN